jgi:hypothetical protein
LPTPIRPLSSRLTTVANTFSRAIPRLDMSSSTRCRIRGSLTEHGRSQRLTRSR